jgi:protein-L-isoaspartate(D-aspartate) O-methyltransferase
MILEKFLEITNSYQTERDVMVRSQIEFRGLHDPRLLAAMRSLPRHLFVREEDEQNAYNDEPIPIGFKQTISQPYITALMTSLACLEGQESVLEVGTGSGYQAALLAMMTRHVISIERIPELARRAQKVLHEIGITNVDIHTGDGTLGYPPGAPYAAILVTAAAPLAPQVLLDQLVPNNGRLVIPTGDRGVQQLQVWQREGNHFEYEDILPVAFVPLLGRFGWRIPE